MVVGSSDRSTQFGGVPVVGGGQVAAGAGVGAGAAMSVTSRRAARLIEDVKGTLASIERGQSAPPTKHIDPSRSPSCRASAMRDRTRRRWVRLFKPT